MGLLRIASRTATSIAIISILSAVWFYKYSGASDSVIVESAVRTSDHTRNSASGQRNQRCEILDKRILLLVSTLDGQLSALDLAKDGLLSWRLETGTKGLLSSSITNNIEFTKDGKRTRLIPSLDGGLYRFNGESVEAIPYSAEKLLSSSFVLDDAITIVGGKEIKSYGVDAKTGRVHYVCGIDSGECDMCGDQEILDSDDIIVVKRWTQTVRAKEMRSGYEKWNFSVGQLDLTFLPGTHEGPVMSDDEDVIVETCINSEDEFIIDSQGVDSDDIKVSVAAGVVARVHAKDNSRILWQYKFASPVANVWLLQDGVLEQLNLFDNRHIPSLDHEKISMDGLPGPLMYIGVHHKQLYVQPSTQLSQDVHASVEQSGVVSAPKVKWRPYLATAPSRTPWLSEQCNIPGAKAEETGLTMWNYPYDNGFYLFSDNCRQNQSPTVTIRGPYNTNTDDYTFQEVIPITLWNWWREILAIVFITVFATLFLSSRMIKHVYHHRYMAIAMTNKSAEKSQSNKSGEENAVIETMATVAEHLPNVVEYSSRYYSDFEQVQCLGRGGFGVVFEAKNKLDDCNYAIKRISLPNRPESKEKVMREVKALAKLDHVNIVRYFQSWIEQPPIGWQEDRDQQWDDSEGLTPTPCNSVQGAPDSEDLAAMAPENVTSCSDAQSKGDFVHAQHRNAHKSRISDLSQTNNDSFDIQFVDSDNEETGSGSNNNNLPFQSYCDELRNDMDANNRLLLEESLKKNRNYDSTGSFNIVFEKSYGGADKSSNADSVICEEHLEDLTNDSRESVNLSISPKSFSMSSHGRRRFSRRNSDSEPNLPLVAGRLWKTSPGNTLEDFDESLSGLTRNTRSDDVGDKRRGNRDKRLFLYIQMQLCRRESLKDWLNANTLRRDRGNCLDIFDQIVSAMEYVHDSGLMHRDLKPSNIFFSMDGIIKIGDFGLVTAMAEYDDGRHKLSHRSRNSKHTDQVGTQLYMSPEQIAGKPYNYKVDIFAMGLIFFELVYPFSTQMERVTTLVDVRRNAFPERFRRELPTECKFVAHLLAHNPNDRPDISNIQDSELLRNYEPPKPVKKHRTRTKSSSST